MALARFEPTIPTSELPQAHALRSRGHWNGPKVLHLVSQKVWLYIIENAIHKKFEYKSV